MKNFLPVSLMLIAILPCKFQSEPQKPRLPGLLVASHHSRPPRNQTPCRQLSKMAALSRPLFRCHS